MQLTVLVALEGSEHLCQPMLLYCVSTHKQVTLGTLPNTVKQQVPAEDVCHARRGPYGGHVADPMSTPNGPQTAGRDVSRSRC